MRSIVVLLAAVTCLAAPPWTLADQGAAGPAAAPPRAITISFKLDPRLAGPTYGGERWISPPTYTGASAQRAVEAKAVAVDARGSPTPGTLEWSSADPELVEVSPARGERVTISVKGVGNGTVQVRQGDVVRRLAVTATRAGGVWQVRIVQ